MSYIDSYVLRLIYMLDFNNTKNILIFFFIPCFALSQNLWVDNPSFEGPPGAGITPAPWFTCMPGQTPDTQPGSWGVDLPASDGNTYLGFASDNSFDWIEGASQELLNETTLNPEAMTAGTNYQFTIDITGFALSDAFFFFSDNAELVIYGGYMACPQVELLWNSGDTPNNVWTTYNVDFTPSADYTYIMLQINTLDSSGFGHILIDNMTPIIPQCQVLTVDNTGPSCQGNDGFIETSILDNGDATLPFSYIWSNGETTPNIYNLAPGNYDLEVTDADGDCVASLSQVIIGLNVEGVEINNSCEGENEGSINVTVTGGTGNYTYEWSNGVITEDLSNLSAGNYSLTVADTNGCETSLEFTVSEPEILSASISVSDASCNGEGDGSAELTVTGGTTPYDTDDLTALSAGTYTTTVVDDNGCETSVAFTVLEPNPLSASISVSDVSCNGESDGSAELIVTGGTAPYNTEDLTGLSAGTYTTIVVDDNGCETSVEFSVLEPDPPLLIISSDECNQNFDVSVNNPNNNFQEWVVLEYPEDVIPPDFDNPNSPSTQFHIYEEGEYTIGAIVCGELIQETLSIDDFIYVVNPTYQSCILSANVVLFPSNGTLELLTGPSNATISNSLPNIVVEEYGLYTFEFTACDNQVVNFSIAFGCPPTIPNALTINEDQNNDLLKIHLLSADLYDQSILTIYNRWGQIVFISTQYGMNDDWWDGTHFKTNKKVSTGTYYYALELFHKTKNEKDLFSGYIEIINN